MNTCVKYLSCTSATLKLANSLNFETFNHKIKVSEIVVLSLIMFVVIAKITKIPKVLFDTEYEELTI